jgi:pyruvate dehydrogenase E2 component (dihydrolipoamide acetyltransferase)
MPTNILMPALSPTMTEGTLAKWVKKEGDTVKAGDVVAEIETDKATMEVEAVDEGKLGKILVPAGTAGVAVNTPIAMLLEEGEDAGALKDAPKAAAPKKEEPKKAAPAPSTHGKARQETAAQKQVTAGDRVFASPLAKRMAAQMGIDLSALKGSGPRGRIVKADLDGGKASPQPLSGGEGLAAAGQARKAAPAAGGVVLPAGPDARQLADMLGMKYKEIPNNSIRKVVARRLLESKLTVPHFYLTVECNIDRLMATRAEMNEKADGKFKLSVNDFVIKACAMALKAYPAANTSWTDEAILQYENADISVAVSTPNGLITPIVKAAEGKGLRQISDEVKDLAKRARDGKLKPEEFQGGTFCVSNLGMYGVQEFGAIINPPQSCILAVGAGEQKPYVDKGEIKIGTFMKCTLSVDHRSVDGSVGAEYLQILKQYIENPTAMLL